MNSADAFQRMCRCCMMVDQNFHSLYENAKNQLKICEMLSTMFPQLLINSGDQLPQQICVTCMKLLNIAYSFHQMCIASAKQLLNMRTDSILISHELSFNATSTMGQDPLQLDKLPNYTICIKSEENEELENVKDIVVEEFVLSAQHLNASKLEAKSQPEESCANNTNRVESGCGKTDDEVTEDGELQKKSRTSDMHNETSVNEIEAESQPEESCANNTNSMASRCGETEDAVDEDEELQKKSRISDMHNETGVNEIEAESQLEESWDHTNSVASGRSETEDEVDEDEELQKTSRISDMHNETGVNEIEKPTGRNRCYPKVACPHCDKVFDRVYNYKRHFMVLHSDQREFKIQPLKECEVRKTCKKMRKCPSPPPDGFKCPECPRRFERGRSLAAHMHIHLKTMNIQTYKCDICSKKFRKFTQLAKHAQTHPENQKYKCTLCEKTFALEAHFIEHMNKHNGLKPYVCVYCNKAFQQNSLLNKHQRTHTGEKPYLCAQCGKSFKNSSCLRQHKLRHSDEKRFQCPECPSKFTCQSDQIQHTATHLGVKPYKCEICGSCFTRPASLKNHKKRHLGERPHKCKECNMSFIFTAQLKQHTYTHTGEKPYKCTYCERAFALNGDLNKHLRLHVGEKTYMCDQCPEKFKYMAELRGHLAMHYKQQLAAVTTSSSTSTPAAIDTASVESKDDLKKKNLNRFCYC